MYIIMAIVLMIFITGQRFVLSEPVVDKETKMRETLRIMSMRSSVYGLLVIFPSFALSDCTCSFMVFLMPRLMMSDMELTRWASAIILLHRVRCWASLYTLDSSYPEAIE